MVEARITTWWDPACQKAINAVKKAGKGSTEIIMKQLKVGYCRANYLLGILQRSGIVSEAGNTKGTYKLIKSKS